MAGENPQTTLPPVPREPIIDTRGRMSNQWERWIQQVQRVLSFAGGIAWGIVNKAGSKLSDLAERTHAMLTNIAGTGVNHISETENAEITALDGLVSGMVAKTNNAEYAARTITGTADEVTVADGDGVSGNPVIGLPELISTPRKFGTVTDNTTFEADGMVVFNGNATVWKDIKFPMAPPKTVGAGNPTLTTYNGNMRGYSFAINDVHDFDPQEIDHDAKVGSTATWHVHFISSSNDGTDRGVAYEIEYAVEPTTGILPVPTVISAELTIPAGTAVNTPQRVNINTFVVPTIAKLVYARIKRIAAVGAAPSVDPILSALHFHYEIDTVGSREILTK
jgi:hypothetical protein